MQNKKSIEAVDRDEFVTRLAFLFHEIWRKTRKTGKMTFEPCWKVVKDKKFLKSLQEKDLPKTIRINNCVVEQDIANTSFDDLSFDWKMENIEASKLVADIVLSNKKFTENEIGDLIHEAWLKRNAWAKGNLKLDVQFQKLSFKEKQKDLRQYRIGKKTYKTMLKEIRKKNS